MFDYHITVVAQLSHQVPLAYSMAPRTVPRLVSRVTNPGPPVQNGTTPNEREDLGLTEGAALRRPDASEGT
jgi:hypothetical protein